MSAAEIALQALEDGQGADIKTLPTAAQSGGMFSCMIVATANSARHAAALAERTRLAVKRAGLPPGHVETSEGSVWILVDCGDVVVHIMQEEARRHYDLEGLWGFEPEE